MYKKFKWAILLSCVTFIISCSSNKNLSSTVFFEETVICTGITDRGDYILDVCVMDNNTLNIEQKAKKAALQKILFDGIIGKADTRAPKIEPLCHGAYYDFKDFFDTFFTSDGEFSNYAELIPNIPPVTTKISGGYKVLYKIIVKKDKLRSCLEKQGIIKSLSNVS